MRAAYLFLAALPVWAGNARLDVRFTPAAPSLSDLIHMEVKLVGVEGSEVALRPPDIPPDCVLLKSGSADTTSLSLVLDPIKPGSCRIPAFQTRCLHGSTVDCDVRSAETVIPISTVVTANPPDIRDQDGTPVPLHGPKVVTETLSVVPRFVSALVFLAGAAAFWRWRNHRISPLQTAERRLRNLTVETPDAFHQLIAVLRDYLDQRLAIGAVSLSSPELLDALQRRSVGEGSTASKLAAFLATCDHAKFAGDAVSNTGFNAALEQCRALLQYLDFDLARRSRAGL